MAPKFPRSRKPSMAKAKKMISKAHKAKAKKNMDTYFLKAKNIYTLTPQQGLGVSNYVYQAFNMDAVGLAGATYLDNAEFRLWALQYDKYRVNSVKIIVTPKANVLDAVNNQNDGTLNTTGDNVWHTVIDRDSNGPNSKNLLARYPSYRKYSVFKPFSRTYAIKYPTGVWLDADSPSTFSMAKELGLKGSITMYGENFIEENFEVINEPVCQVQVEWNIVFQGKTSNSLTGVYDASGNLTGVTINALTVEDMLPQTTLTNVSGTLDLDTRRTIDESGNTVEVKINDRGQEIV